MKEARQEVFVRSIDSPNLRSTAVLLDQKGSKCSCLTNFTNLITTT